MDKERMKTKKEIESIEFDEEKREVTIIIKNCCVYDSFSRSLEPMVKKAFKKWIMESENQKLVGWTYISRWRLNLNRPFKEQNAGEQEEKDHLGNNLYKYKGVIEIF